MLYDLCFRGQHKIGHVVLSFLHINGFVLLIIYVYYFINIHEYNFLAHNCLFSYLLQNNYSLVDKNHISFIFISLIPSKTPDTYIVLINVSEQMYNWVIIF